MARPIALPPLTDAEAVALRHQRAAQAGQRTKRKYVTARSIQQVSGLAPWMKRYAEQLATFPFEPPIAERLKIASAAAGVKVGPPGLFTLEGRADFKAAFAYAKAGDGGARVAVERIIPRGVELYGKLIEELHKRFDIDPRTVPVRETFAVAEACVDRAYPAKADAGGVSHVVIHLTTKQSASLDSPPLDVTFEYLAPPAPQAAEPPAYAAALPAASSTPPASA